MYKVLDHFEDSPICGSAVYNGEKTIRRLVESRTVFYSTACCKRSAMSLRHPHYTVAQLIYELLSKLDTQFPWYLSQHALLRHTSSGVFHLTITKTG